MKKVFVLMLLVLLFGNFVTTDASVLEMKEMQGFVDDLSTIYESWNDAKIYRNEILFDVDDTIIGVIYRVYVDNEQQGYVISLDDYGIVEVKFEGSDDAIEINGKVYYAFPGIFFDKLKRDELLAEETVNVDSQYYGSGEGFIADVIWNYWRIDSYTYDLITYDFNSGTPYLPSNVTTSSSSYHTQKYILNVPDYLNYDDAYACVPTATAMMMAYYDNEYRTSWTSFDGSSDYPLVADGGNNAMVEDLIEHFISLMHANKPGTANDGVSPVEFSDGLTAHFDTTLYPYYDAYVSFINDSDPNTDNEYDDYKILIQRGNPTVLFVNGNPGSPYVVNHAVAGIGYFTNITMGTGFVVYDENDHGISLITDDFVEYFGFIYND